MYCINIAKIIKNYYTYEWMPMYIQDCEELCECFSAEISVKRNVTANNINNNN